MLSTQAPKTAFISYSSYDRKEAFSIKELLEAIHIKVWMDYFDIQTTAELRQELRIKVEQAEIFCLLLSPTAVESPWVNQEIETAIAAANRGLRILPIVLRPCRIPEQLADIVGFDASEGLEHKAVRLRLTRALSGNAAVDDKVLLDAANRQLIANREIVARAEEELPGIDQQLAVFAAQPVRSVDAVVVSDTLPRDPNTILELQLKLDDLFHGTMSFYIASYREGRTWPEEFGLEEAEYTEFFLHDRPRLDVQFRWFDRVVPLSPQIDGTDLKDLPATFSLQFDGTEFKPKGEFHLPQTFEIPSLETLETQRSSFRLIAHDAVQKRAREIAADTDIDVQLWGGTSEGERFCLYASRTTPTQRVIQSSEYLGHVSSPIRRTALLQAYARTAREDRRPEILEALKKGTFHSDEQRRLAAQFRYSEAILARGRALHRDAYVKFQETAELMQPLVQGQKKPSLRDATLMYRACRTMVEIWVRQDSFKQAGQIGETLGSIAQAFRDSDPEDPDYQRIWADAVHTNAFVHARLGENTRAAAELRENVATYEQLYKALPSLARQRAYLEALTYSVQSAREWNIEKSLPIQKWKAVLAAEVGDSNAQRLTTPPPEIPRWLEPCDPPGWPTVPLKSATLRYSLRIPKRWAVTPHVRGTAREIEHLYIGTRKAEWLIISFMEKATATSNMTDWVEACIAMSGFPVILEQDPLPALRSWNYLGKLPGFAKKLGADEAHAYTGLANYPEDSGTVLGRLYIVMARRKSFAWKIALSFETACFEGMPEEKVYANDHVRAGAILGNLRLGGASKAKAAANERKTHET
jgi:hypothetical protein